MRIGLLVVILALGLALLASSAAPGSESRKKATLKLAGGAPLTSAARTSFRASACASAISGKRSRTKQVTAGRAGGFVVRFAAAYDRCTATIVRAVGARGSQAALKLPPLGCPAP